MATLTVYPDAGSGSTTVDGEVQRTAAGGVGGAGESYTNIRTGAGTATTSVSDTVINAILLLAGTVLNQYSENHRSIYTFDTSGLGASSSISSATFSVAGYNKDDALGATPSLAAVLATPASNNNLVDADYSQVSTTEIASRIAYASIATNTGGGTYNDFALNATGLANISKTGITKFGLREGKYDIDAGTPPWATLQPRYSMNGFYADQSGTSSDPKLVVTYTTSSVKTKNGLAVASVKTVNGLAIASVKTHNGLA